MFDNLYKYVYIIQQFLHPCKEKRGILSKNADFGAVLELARIMLYI